MLSFRFSAVNQFEVRHSVSISVTSTKHGEWMVFSPGCRGTGTVGAYTFRVLWLASNRAKSAGVSLPCAGQAKQIDSPRSALLLPFCSNRPRTWATGQSHQSVKESFWKCFQGAYTIIFRINVNAATLQIFIIDKKFCFGLSQNVTVPIDGKTWGLVGLLGVAELGLVSCLITTVCTKDLTLCGRYCSTVHPKHLCDAAATQEFLWRAHMAFSDVKRKK